MSVKEVKPGEIVEYLHNNQVNIGCVIEKEKKQVKVININQRLVKLSTSRILPWIGPFISSSSRENVLRSLSEHERKRKELEKSINIVELWEVLEGEIKELEVVFAASLLWENPDEDQIAALGRKLFKSRTHFRFEPPMFRVYSSKEVEIRLKEEKANEERRRIVEKGQEFFQAILHNRSVPAIEEKIEKKLKEILFEKIKDSENRNIESLWKEISSGLNPNPFLPLILARKWGIIPRHYNYLLDQADYFWGDEWSKRFSETVDIIVEKIKNYSGPVKKLPVVSIDSETTKDIDDAICVKKQNDNFEVIIALACPVLFWEFGSGLDQQVLHRCSSIYLPEGTSHMLPEVLATDVFSLTSNSPKPSLVLRLILDSRAEVIKEDICFEWIEVEENITYRMVERDLEEKFEKSRFYDAYQLAEILRKKRVEKGAVIVEQTEPVIELNEVDDDVLVTLKAPEEYSKAQLIVSELMVLVNSFVAEWAKKREIPLIHRTQDMLISDTLKGVWTDPVDIYRVMKEMAPSILEVVPKPHISLGVSSYSPISSPIRRYSDFLNVAQIFYYLKNQRPVFTTKELEEKLPYISSRLQMVSKVQKFRNRYWKLLYFKRSGEKMWSAVVVGEEGDNLVFSLPKEQILLKAPKKMVKTVPSLGKRVKLKLSHIDPLINSVRISSVKREDEDG